MSSNNKKTEIMSCPVIDEDYNESVLTLSVERTKKKGRIFILEKVTENKKRDVILRIFPENECLRAVRSFRRFVLLSDEIKAGY